MHLMCDTKPARKKKYGEYISDYFFNEARGF